MTDAPLPTAQAEQLTQVLAQANALYRENRYADVETLLFNAQKAGLRNTESLNLRGVALAGMERYWDSIWCYRDALALNPRASGIWTNMGNALAHVKHLDSSVHCHEQAVFHAPKPDAMLYHNLGLAFAEAGNHPDAIIAFSHALQANPEYHLARWDRGRSYLFLANYRQAWPDYEIRLETGQVPKRNWPGERWKGQPYAGKTLLLLTEQGFGDAIWIARYLAQVKALGGRLIMECQSELVRLIDHLGIVDEFVPNGSLPAADYHCHICSLPGLFTHDLASIPTRPYFKVPAQLIDKFAPLFPKDLKKLKIGIVWSGSLTFKRNSERAQPMMRFFQSLAMAGVQLYSLQKGPREEDLGHLANSNGPIINLAPHLTDFMDTAAVVSHLDLIVMTDSSVAHLAGALGKPVWLLLGYVAHWLWLLDRNDCPWYPSIRLYRPKSDGDWNSVFDQILFDMMQMIRL